MVDFLSFLPALSRRPQPDGSPTDEPEAMRAGDVSRPYVVGYKFRPPPVQPEHVERLKVVAVELASYVLPAESADDLEWRLSDAVFSDSFGEFRSLRGDVWLADTVGGSAPLNGVDSEVLTMCNSGERIGFFFSFELTAAMHRHSHEMPPERAAELMPPMSLQERLYGDTVAREVQEALYGCYSAEVCMLALLWQKPSEELRSLLQTTVLRGYRLFIPFAVGAVQAVTGQKFPASTFGSFVPLDIVAVHTRADAERDALRRLRDDAVARLPSTQPDEGEA